MKNPSFVFTPQKVMDYTRKGSSDGAFDIDLSSPDGVSRTFRQMSDDSPGSPDVDIPMARLGGQCGPKFCSRDSTPRNSFLEVPGSPSSRTFPGNYSRQLSTSSQSNLIGDESWSVVELSVPLPLPRPTDLNLNLNLNKSNKSRKNIGATIAVLGVLSVIVGVIILLTQKNQVTWFSENTNLSIKALHGVYSTTTTTPVPVQLNKRAFSSPASSIGSFFTSSGVLFIMVGFSVVFGTPLKPKRRPRVIIRPQLARRVSTIDNEPCTSRAESPNPGLYQRFSMPGPLSPECPTIGTRFTPDIFATINERNRY